MAPAAARSSERRPFSKSAEKAQDPCPEAHMRDGEAARAVSRAATYGKKTTTSDCGSIPLSLFEVVAIVAGLSVAWAVTATTQKSLRTLRRSTDPGLPLVRVQPDFFFLNATPNNETREDGGGLAERLEACALERGATAQKNALGTLFERSRSFAAGFNRAGVAQLRATPETACLAPFFDAVRDARASAWVLNVLVCEPRGAEEAADDKRGHNAPPVDWHVDQTVALHVPVAHFAASRVDVWYARVPDGLVGGELELARFSDAWLDRHAMRSFDDPNSKRVRALNDVDEDALVWETVETDLVPETSQPRRAFTTQETTTTR